MSSTARGGEGRAARRDDGTVAVSGVLTFDTVPDVYEQSLAWWSPAPVPLTVDLAGVRHADSAGLALLVEWLRRARAQGAELRFRHVPEQLRSLARVHGLGRALGLGDPNSRNRSGS